VSGSVSGSAEPFGSEQCGELTAEPLRAELLAEDSPNGSTEFTEVCSPNCSPKFDNTLGKERRRKWDYISIY